MGERRRTMIGLLVEQSDIKGEKARLYLWGVNEAAMQRRGADGSGDEDQACDGCAVPPPPRTWSDISRLNVKTRSKAKKRGRTSPDRRTWAP